MIKNIIIDRLLILTETTYGKTQTDPARTEMLPICEVTNSADKWGSRERVMNFRFPCPSCEKTIVGELRQEMGKQTHENRVDAIIDAYQEGVDDGESNSLRNNPHQKGTSEHYAWARGESVGYGRQEAYRCEHL